MTHSHLDNLGFYSDEKLELSRMKPIANIPNFAKPSGGLWLSPFTSSTTTVWSDWLSRADWRPYADEARATEVNLKPDANILTISSHDDFAHILSCYLRLDPDPFALLLDDELAFKEFLDFEAIAQDWDGIHLTKRGASETHRMFVDGKSVANLNVWDIESVLVFSADALTL